MAHKRSRAARAPAWKEQAAYWGVRAGAAMVNVAGVEPSMRALRRAGGLFAASPFNRRRLARAIEHISWCFPEWEPPLVREYAIESFRHLFCLGAEMAISPRLLNEDGYPAHIELGDLAQGLHALCADRPCILITGHCGNWELLGYTLALLGLPMHALYRPLDLSPLDRWATETRSRRGLTLVDKFGAAAVLPTLLDRRLPVGFIADQNAGDRGLFVPFFNRLASAYKTIGLLAMRYGAMVLCGQARRLSGMSAPADARSSRARAIGSAAARESQTFRYRLDVVDLFGPADWSGQPDPLFYITARYRRAIETMVQRAPEQYLWMHRNWKSRPAHERKGRPFPGQLREKIASLPWIDDDDVERIVERSARDAAELARSRGGPSAEPAARLDI